MSDDRDPTDGPDPAAEASDRPAPARPGGAPFVRRGSVHGSISPGRRITTSYMPSAQRRARPEGTRPPAAAAPSDRPMVGSGYGSPIPPMAELLDPGPAPGERVDEDMAGAGGPLPLLGSQPVFGRYDISDEDAPVDGESAGAAADPGAGAKSPG